MTTWDAQFVRSNLHQVEYLHIAWEKGNPLGSYRLTGALRSGSQGTIDFPDWNKVAWFLIEIASIFTLSKDSIDSRLYHQVDNSGQFIQLPYSAWVQAMDTQKPGTWVVWDLGEDQPHLVIQHPDLGIPENRTPAWREGYLAGLAYHEGDLEPHPYQPTEDKYYAFREGFDTALKSRLPKGHIGKGHLFRDDLGYYWFWDNSWGKLRCLSDEGTGLEGGYYCDSWKEAKQELVGGGCLEEYKAIPPDERWILSREKSQPEGG